MAEFERAFPSTLSELLEIEVDFDAMDFEAYAEFTSGEENNEWIKAWTGNSELTGEEYRFFGQDGTGGLVGFWMADPDEADLLEQPVVFFGSEGELKVVARNFHDYLWLLADGIGPMEAAEYGAEDAEEVTRFSEFAARHAADSRKTAAEVLAAAEQAFPDFEKRIRALVR